MKKAAHEYRKIVVRNYIIIFLVASCAAGLHGMPAPFSVGDRIGLYGEVDSPDAIFRRRPDPFWGATFDDREEDFGQAVQENRLGAGSVTWPDTHAPCNATIGIAGHEDLPGNPEIQLPETKRKYRCPMCPKSFSHKSHLVIHVRVHSGERPFACILCPKAFKHSGLLNRHMETHLKKKKFVCSEPTCGRLFFSSGGVQEHVTSVHKQMGKKHKCPDCNRGFARPNHLRKHILKCVPEVGE